MNITNSTYNTTNFTFNTTSNYSDFYDHNRYFIIAIIISIVAWFGIKKHMFGMQIKITGSAPRAAKFAGFNDNKTVLYSLLISGGLAGLAGFFEASGPAGQLTPGLPQFYGFTAIIVAFLARLHPIGILFSSLLSEAVWPILKKKLKRSFICSTQWL